MYEVHEDKTIPFPWTMAGKKSAFSPNFIDVLCGECGWSFASARLEWVDHGSYFRALMNCPNCHKTTTFFMTEPQKTSSQEQHSRIFMYPPPTPDIDIPAIVSDLSPRFVKIYDQAMQASVIGLNELEGVGYRKALEILIKDYAIDNNSEDEKIIKEKSLGACIADYLDNDLASLAIGANLIGNDETHYVRYWEEKSLPNMLEFMTAVILEIASKLKKKQLHLEAAEGSQLVKNRRKQARSK